MDSESLRFEDQLHRPQFGIIHLLLWTAASAVLLKLHVAMGLGAVQGTRGLRAYAWVRRSFEVGQVILVAAAFTGTCLLVQLRMRGVISQFQPGHWILC